MDMTLGISGLSLNLDVLTYTALWFLMSLIFSGENPISSYSCRSTRLPRFSECSTILSSYLCWKGLLNPPSLRRSLSS